jgi:hypothetical protein
VWRKSPYGLAISLEKCILRLTKKGGTKCQ